MKLPVDPRESVRKRSFAERAAFPLVPLVAVALAAVVTVRGEARAGGPLVVDQPVGRAEGKFHFGAIDVDDGRITWGYPRRPETFRGGGHYVLGERFGLDIANLPRKGEGHIGGFGFLPQDGVNYIHPLSSLKAAGQSGSHASTMNGLLRDNYNGWRALLPPQHLEAALEALTARTGRPLVLDPDITGSTRFPLNPKHLPGIDITVIRVEHASATLPRIIADVNARHFAKARIAQAHGFVAENAHMLVDDAVVGENATRYPGMLDENPALARAASAYARGEGELAVLKMWQAQEPVYAAGPRIAARIGTPAPVGWGKAAGAAGVYFLAEETGAFAALDWQLFGAVPIPEEEKLPLSDLPSDFFYGPSPRKQALLARANERNQAAQAKYAEGEWSTWRTLRYRWTVFWADAPWNQ